MDTDPQVLAGKAKECFAANEELLTKETPKAPFALVALQSGITLMEQSLSGAHKGTLTPAHTCTQARTGPRRGTS